MGVPGERQDRSVEDKMLCYKWWTLLLWSTVGRAISYVQTGVSLLSCTKVIVITVSQDNFLVVVVVVAFPLLERYWEGCFEDSFPICAVLFFLPRGDQLMQTNSTLWARISPQWLSEPRQL